MTINSNEKDYTKLREELNENNTYWLHKLVPEGKIIKSEYRAGSFMGGASRKGDGSFSYDLTKNIYKDHVDSSIGRNRHGIFGLYQEQHPEAKPHEVYAYFKGEPVDHVKVKQLKKQVEAPQEKPDTTYFKSEADQEKLIEALETHSKNRAKRNEWEFVCNHYYTRPDKTIVYVMARFKKKDGNKEIRPISRILNTEKITGYGVPSKKFIPYKLHEIMGNDKPILMVEGEKTVDYIEPIIKEHFAVTTFTYGAGTISRLEAESFRHFKDRKVFLWPDKDAEGQGYEAFKLAAQTLEKVAKSVAIVDVRKIKQLTIEKNDLADLVEDKAIQTYEDFFKMLSENLRGNKPAPIEPEVVTTFDNPEVYSEMGEQIPTIAASSAENLVMFNAIENKDKRAASSVGKLTEVQVSEILESKLLPFKIYHDLFVDADVVEYLHKDGEYKTTTLKGVEPLVLNHLQKCGFKVNRPQVATALAAYALESIEIRDTLKESTLEYEKYYDPSYRLDQFFQTYYGVEDNEYHRKLSLIFLQNMISCWIGDDLPNDFCIVLTGGQGDGKSRTGFALAGDGNVGELSGRNLDDTRTLKTELNRKLAVQFSEFERQGKQGVNALKRFISMTSFSYNKKYSEEEGNLKIRAFKYITTNDSIVFSDTTGNRRFGIVRTVGAVNIDKIIEDRAKIIGSALHLYKANMERGLTHNKMCMDAEFVKLRDEYIQDFTDRHELHEDILNWLCGYTKDMSGNVTYDDPKENVKLVEVMKQMEHIRGSFGGSVKKSEATSLMNEIGCVRNNRTSRWNLPPKYRNLLR